MNLQQRPIEYAACRPGNMARIRVPQAHYGVALGPCRDIGFIYTSVAQCVALAIVAEPNNKKLVKVVLGHIDDHSLPDLQTQNIIAQFGTHPKNVRGYVMTGDAENSVLNTVMHELEQARIPCQFDILDGTVVDLAIDLVTGNPVPAVKTSHVPEYISNKENDIRYFEFIMGERLRFGRTSLIKAPIACAFDLRKGIPAGYNRKLPKHRALQNPGLYR